MVILPSFPRKLRDLSQRRHALIIPPDDTLPKRLAQIDITLRITGDVMDVKELSKTSPAMPAEKADDLERLAIHDLNFLIHTIGYVEKLLLLVWRERNIECGSFFAESLPFYISFLHICTVWLKHLNAVIPA